MYVRGQVSYMYVDESCGTKISGTKQSDGCECQGRESICM